jgi:hypothetical protein
MLAGPPHKRKPSSAKLRFDLTDDVRAQVYRKASIGQVRKFVAEIAPP